MWCEKNEECGENARHIYTDFFMLFTIQKISQAHILQQCWKSLAGYNTESSRTI